jgi:hypothetical protein
MGSDRNLLFGILALQMDFIGRDALIAAMHAWVLDKAKPLGQILLDQGVLPAKARDVLDALVAQHLELHGNDPERSLAAVVAPEAVRAELRRIADDELHASLAQLPATLPALHDLPSTIAAVTADGARFQVLRSHAKGGLALTQFQLGHQAEAAATLGRLREGIKKRLFDREAEDLLQEAESVIEPPK